MCKLIRDLLTKDAQGFCPRRTLTMEVRSLDGGDASILQGCS